MKQETSSKVRALVADKATLLPWLGTLGVLIFYVGINLWLYESVARLIKGAANPFFAILILLATLVGQTLTVVQTWRLMRESSYLRHLRTHLRQHARQPQEEQEEALQEELSFNKKLQHLAVWRLFSQLQQRGSRVQGYDQPLLRMHLRAFEDEVQRRAVLAQYIANTLIGLGLFGTFLGLIVTLKEVASLIGLFSMAGTGDSSDMMSQFFQKMSGPLGGMGEAFVASLLGLGGSIVNNIQLLAFKRLQKHLTYQAESSYVAAAEAMYGTRGQDEEGLPVALDVRLGELQLKEMTALRIDMHKQTDAILMAASRMRQASETMEQVLEHLDRIHQQDDLRPRLEQAAIAIEQRLGVLVTKFEENQQAQHGLLVVSRSMSDALQRLNDTNTQIASAINENVSETLALRVVVMDTANQGRDEWRQNCADIKQTLRSALESMASDLSEGVRHQREQASVLNDISTHMHGSVNGVHNLTQNTQRIADKVQPQLVELIARLEKNDQALQSFVKHDWSELHNKIDRLGHNAQSGRSRS